MKSKFKKTLIIGMISTVLTLSMSVTANAQCPITSLFGGNNIITSLFGSNSNNSTSCTSASCTSGNVNNILNIFRNHVTGNNKTCKTGNCNSNNTCTTGNCSTNTTCKTGKCN